MFGINIYFLHKIAKNEDNKMKNLKTLPDAKEQVKNLLGKNVKLKINKGRNKIVHLTATINEVYPSMFVISPTSEVELDRKSYSYSDMLCGDIVIL